MSATFFSQLDKSFKDVPVTEEGVDTLAFLQASEGLVKMFDVLGSAAFAPVKSDLTSNIAKIRTRYNAAPAQSQTLENLIKAEQSVDKKRTATQALLWLTRGLAFTSQALRRSLDNPSEELSVSFTKAYEATLKQFHSFVIRPIFSLAMKACPYRADFYAKLGEPREVVDQEFQEWLKALEAIVSRIEAFLPPYSKGL